MKLFIFIGVCFLAFCVQAQFDHVDRTGATLNLAIQSANTVNGIQQYSATVNDLVYGAACQCTLHTVSNVQTNNGPYNSGTFFRVTILNPANSTLFHTFGTQEETGAFEILGGTFSTTGTCAPSATACEFDYYCDNYPSVTPLEVYICTSTSADTAADEFNFYTLTVTQWTAGIQIVDSTTRTEAQSTGVINPYQTSNLGPQNFVHYYHKLVSTPAENGKSSRLFIEATNWAGATGSAYICVSFSNLVATTSSLSSVVFPGGDLEGPTIIPNSVISTPTECPIYCQEGTVSGAGSVVAVSFPGCFGGACRFPEDIWIGVRPPSASVTSTYTVQVRFRDFTIPSLTLINAFPSEFDRDLSVTTCDGNIGDFSCVDYYEVVTKPTVASGEESLLYLSIETFAVHGGVVSTFIADGYLGGAQSQCASCPVQTCGPSDSPPQDATFKADCYTVLQYCDWSGDQDWTISVEASAQDNSLDSVEYGLRVTAGTFPVTTVSIDETYDGTPYKGELKPFHYHHYKISFTEADIYDDTLFDVQLYADHRELPVSIAWNYNAFANIQCNVYEQVCSTVPACTETNVGTDYNYPYASADDGYCRFAFAPCGKDKDTTAMNYLQAGTYYFAVSASTADDYGLHAPYTVLFNVKRGLQIFDEVPVQGHLFFNELSRQYIFDVPNETTQRFSVSISDVKNGALQLFVGCNKPTGPCDCYDNSVATCTADSSVAGRCTVQITTVGICACDVYYISVFNTAAEFPLLDSPAAYILNVDIDYRTPRNTIEATRAAVSYSAENSDSNENSFQLTTTNLYPKEHDQLLLTITQAAYYGSADSVLTISTPCGALSSTCEAHSSGIDYLAEKSFAHCSIVLQSCVSTCNNGCYETDSMLRWDPTQTYWVDVSSNSMWTLTVQVVTSNPLTLTDSVPFEAYVREQDLYVHFVFPLPTTKSANARLEIAAYSNRNVQGDLDLYVNYASMAGLVSHCYSWDMECTINAVRPSCVMNVDACELKDLTGSYYLSLRSVSSGFISPKSIEKQVTLMASIYEPTPLLTTEMPIGAHAFDDQIFYYSVTLPELVSGSIVGRVLAIEVGGVYEGQIEFTISQDAPADYCTCATGGILLAGEDNEWRRYPCELTSGAVYYIRVTGTPNVNCDAVDFFVHARLYDVTASTITLTTSNVTSVIGAYDTTTFVIGHNEWHALQFSTNAPAGAALNIDITQANVNVRNVEAILSIGAVATRAGFNSDSSAVGSAIGPLPNTDGCPTQYGVCTGLLTTTCSIYVPTCSVPQGATTWFLTFSGEDMAASENSDPISISIRLVAPTSVVTFPALSDYTTTSTSSIAITDSINANYGITHTTTVSGATTGINAGDTLTISYTGNSNGFAVQYGSETDTVACFNDCFRTGNNPTCTFTACESIPSGTWYISVSGATQTGSITVTRSQGPAGTLSVSPISAVNQDFQFEALGVNEYRYHSINVPASTTSHYEVQITGGASFSRVVYVGDSSSDAVFLPGLALSPSSNIILPDGGNTCGGVNIAGISNTCCYDQDTSVFAVVGSVGQYTIRVDKIEFADGNPQSISLPSNVTRTTTLGKVAWFSFTLPEGNHLWFDFAVTSGSARIYSNKGALAGSDAVSFTTDYGACWYNDNTISSICPSAISAGGSCGGFIANDCSGCLADNIGSTYYFAVIPQNNGNATYSITTVAQQRARTLSTSTNSGLTLPMNQGNVEIVDNSISNSQNAPYSHYVWNFSTDFDDISSFIPFTGESGVDVFTLPHVTITISNIVQLGTQTSAVDLVDFYINSGALAGETDCYGGRDILESSPAVLPCMENSDGRASFNTTTNTITCSILLCNLGCSNDVYLSAGRAQQSFIEISYSIQIAQVFTPANPDYDLVSLALSSNTVSSLSHTVTSGNDVVYIRTTGSLPTAYGANVYIPDFKVFVENLNNTSTPDVAIVNGDVCTTVSSLTNECAGSNANNVLFTDGSCYFPLDACNAGNMFLDTNSHYYIRVRRTSGTGTWGFRLSFDAEADSYIDKTATTLAVTRNGVIYEAVKDIESFDSHSYEFTINNGVWGGYNTLSLSVTPVGCLDQHLDVGVSFAEGTNQLTTATPFNAVPFADDCSIDSASSTYSGSSFGISNWCNTWGGIYRTTVWNHLGSVYYEDLPDVYHIQMEVNVNAIPVHLAGNTFYYDMTNSYFEFRPDATNKGVPILFDVTGANVELFVSKNANPFESTANCAWGTATSGINTDIAGDYYASGATGASIRIPECLYTDDTWFIFVSSSVPFDIIACYERSYSPVVFNFDVPYVSTGVITNNVYQYYTFVLPAVASNTGLDVTIYETDCAGCDLTAHYMYGDAGFAAAGSVGGGICDCDGCICSVQSCSTSALGYCSIEGCAHFSQVYVGVVSNTNNCPYEIEATYYQTVYPLVEEIYVCDFVSLYNNEYYVFTMTSGSTDFSRSSITLTVDNLGATALTLEVQTHVAADCDDVVTTSCPANSVCQIVFTCLPDEALILSISTTSTVVVDYQLYFIRSTSTISTISLGSTISESVVFVSASSAFMTSSPVFVSSVFGTSCRTCGNSFAAGDYYIYDAPGVSLSTTTFTSISTSASTVNFNSGYVALTVTVPAGVESFTVYLYDWARDYSNTDYAYYISQGGIAQTEQCGTCGSAGNFVVPTSCSSDASITVTCTFAGTYVINLVNCGFADSCDQSFRARVEFAQTATLIGGNHNSAYSQLISGTDCDSASTSFSFYTVANGPLYVNLKRPAGFVLPVSATASVRSTGSSCSTSSCAVSFTGDYTNSYCAVSPNDCTSCSSGTYYVTVDLSAPVPEGYAVELQVVNEWVPLTSSVSDFIDGSEKHFFSAPVTSASAAFKLTHIGGPAIHFRVSTACPLTGNQGQALAAFEESQVCAFGDCYIWVPTEAELPSGSTYYVELYTDFNDATHTEWERNNNRNAWTQTYYTLSLTTGSANCAAPPSTGFCANTTFAGVNVWSEITQSSVWSMVDPVEKDTEAHGLYDLLLLNDGSCVEENDECKKWLKIFTCLESFPQCDSNGFQVAPCSGVCHKVEEACGANFFVNQPFFNYICCSDRYIKDNSTSTCYNIPVVAAPPPEFYQNDPSVESSFPPPIDVPVFPTIYATMPPASEFIIESSAKEVEVGAQFRREMANSATSLTLSVALLIALIAMLI